MTRALQTFQEDSSRAGAELAGEAAELTDRLRATADDYARIDADLERALITALDLG
ncbi:type VII secretion target [Saccharopolyspora sp. NFXS83]|uniref:type VII secretion target n=1 Tax=Saccharopolyspora sp. NFXS83 TaxID=2993560 RepID=UPI00224AA410|nr:type VII secretion target [Saccharopolyspora sp. NFXS83]MCX2733687.1 type VII secretion target [Saccharopolyspora sp. NFXS83]